jgi:hypothetical protein
MGFLSTNLETFARSLGQVDAILKEQRPIDKKTDELLRFALSIKALRRVQSLACGSITGVRSMPALAPGE